MHTIQLQLAITLGDDAARAVAELLVGGRGGGHAGSLASSARRRGDGLLPV